MPACGLQTIFGLGSGGAALYLYPVITFARPRLLFEFQITNTRHSNPDL